MRTLYSLAIELVTWLVLVPVTYVRMYLARHSKGDGESSPADQLRDAAAVRAYLGDIEPSAPRDRSRLLVHAASAGEMNAASALVHEFAERGWVITISAGNEDAWQMAQGIAARHVEVQRVVRFPWDRAEGMRQWLDAIDPEAVAVVETEIWPNLFHVCDTRDIPLVIAGARLDASAATRYRLGRPFFRRVLKCASLILATDEQQAARYLAIGAPPARVIVGGELKADACSALHPVAKESAPRPPGVLTVLAASTHDGEEALVVEALRGLDAVQLVLAPRHVKRAPDVRRIAEGAAVVDRMGELSALYARADIVVIGGTFVPVGGHDLLEPASRGCAIVAGPYLDNVRSVAEKLSEAGGMRITSDLTSTLHELRDNPATLHSLGEAAARFAASQRGSARLTADRIDRLPRYKL